MKKSLHALQKYFFVTIFSLASVIGWGQTIIDNTATGVSIPVGWSSTNNITTQNIQQGGYYLVESNTTPTYDYIYSNSYNNINGATSVDVSVDIATYGSGTSTALKIQISLDGGTTWGTIQTTSAVDSNTYVTKTVTFAGTITSTNVKFRFYDGTNGSPYVRIKNIIISAYLPITPTLTPTPTSLSGFSYIQSLGPSSSQSFNFTGSNLTGYPGNIIITAPTDYEVSTDNTSFNSSVNVPYSSATLSSTTIYVRLEAGLSVGNYNSENITFSGGGVTSPPTVSCSGTVNPFTVNFAVTSATVNENGTVYTIQVNSNSMGSNTVEIAATGGTATNGNQYTFATTTATFASSTTFTTNVTINNNTTCSGNTDVIFSLQNPSSGCTIGANSQLTLSITDDEYFSGNIKALQFETGDNWSYTGTGAANTTASKYYGTQSYRIGGVGNLETDNVSIVGYNNVTLKVAFAATGVDSDDDLFLDISYDNGSNWFSTKLVDGYSNANINIGSTSASNPTTVATNPWVVNIPSTETQIKVRLRTTTNSTTEYYWVDDIVLSGQYCVSCAGPTTNSTFHANSPQNITTNSVTLNWTPGNGSNRIVILKEDSAVTFVPADNTTYQSNANFGSGTDLGGGQFVVYNGSAGTANVSGLTPGKVYYAAIYDYGCLSSTENYLTSNPGTDFFVVTPENPLNFHKICANNTSLELSWEAPTNGVFDGYIVTVRQGASPSNVNTIDPSTVTTANPDISLSQNYGTSSFFVYKGSANSVNVTGLTTGTSYTFKIYAYTDAGSVYEYSSGTQTTQSVSIPDITSAISFNGNGSANISWTNPSASCYDDVMAVVTTTAGITFTPSGNSYTPNSVYSSPNQVVFKDSTNTLTVTGLTNGVTYYVEIFVRKGLQWSSGVEVAVTPNAVTGTTLQAGDFAIVAINTSAAASSSEDEITFVCFKDITPGTQIYLTDNGYERKFANKWGNSEGIISLIRTTSQLDKGTFVTIRTINGGVKTGSDFKVYVCGSEDTNWTKDEISSGTFDLNKDDQVWFMQGGVWTNITTGNHDATYNGNILYGWTDIAWKTTPAWDLANGTKGSTIPSGLKCFTTDVNNPETGASRVQFNYSAYSSLITNDQLEWIALMNNTANWAYYTSNANYYGSPNYTIYNSCSTVTITNDTHTNGKWNGTQDVNWFNCSNWDTLKVPDQNTNVTFNSTVSHNATIDATATDSDFYGDIAKTYNITIDKPLTIEGNTNNKLEVYGNLTINAGGTLDMDDGNTATQDGQIYLYGNWTNSAGEANFLQGQSTVHLLGSTPQIINGNNHSNVEKFGNLVLGNNFDTAVSNDLYMDGNLTVNANKALVINTSGNYVEVVGNVTNNGTLTVENDGNFIQRDGTYSGNNITVKREALLKRLDYNYWGSPVAGQNVRNFSLGTLINRFYVYNESNDYFDGLFVKNTYPITSLYPNLTYSLTPLVDYTTYAFEAGKGYAVRAPNTFPTSNTTFKGTFVGVPNNGNISVTINKSPDTSIDGVTYIHGNDLVSNPYPSNINIDKFFDDNPLLEKVAYFWTNINPTPEMQGSQYPKSGYINNYAVYCPTGGLQAPNAACNADNSSCSKTPNNIIKVGQGFVVRAKNSGNVIFKNNIRNADNSGLFFNRLANNKDRFWLELKTPLNFVNPILIGYIRGATNNLDQDYDAKLLVEGADSFYSIVDNQKLAIQGKHYPFNDSDVIALGATFYEKGNHTISLKNKEGVFGEKYSIYLHDKQDDVYTDLQKNDYTFLAEKGENKERFEIVYKIPNRNLSTIETDKYSLVIYQAGDNYVVDADKNFESVKITDASGRLLGTIKCGKKQLVIEKNKLPLGLNIFSIIFANEIINKKILVK